MRTLLLTAGLALATALPATAQNVSLEVFAGSLLARSFDQNGAARAFDAGSHLGVRGLINVTPEFGFGLEYNRNETALTGIISVLSAESVMIIGRYEMPVTDQFSAYATLGVGRIEVGLFDGGVTDYGTAQGGQITLGSHYAITDTIGTFAELTHQATFDDINVDGNIFDYNATSFDIGVRVRF